MTSLTLPLVFDLSQVQLTDQQFYQLCINNPDIPLERNAQGALIVMSPVGGDSGNYEMELGTDLAIWNRQTQLGKVFSSSTLFKLPNGGDRSPDAAWIELSRWKSLSAEQRQKFPLIAPDFVIELRSRSDSLKTLQQKMQEYMDSGVRLAWMFNPQDQQVKFIAKDKLQRLVNSQRNCLVRQFYLDLFYKSSLSAKTRKFFAITTCHYTSYKWAGIIKTKAKNIISVLSNDLLYLPAVVFALS